MIRESTQPSLLSRVRDAGDDEAWREFDRKYRDLILGYARSRGLQEADAADVRQLVMMGLARSLRNFRYRPELGRFRDYLRRVVRNAVIRTVSCPRSERQSLWADELDELAPPDDDGLDESWEREWMYHHFRQALRRARASVGDQGLAIFEAVTQGEAVPEVAARFGLSEAAVYKTRQRLRDRLEQLIAEQIRDEEFPERPA